MLQVDRGLRRQLLQRRKGNQAASPHLLYAVGVMLLAHRLRRWQAFLGIVEVGGGDDVRGLTCPLPEHCKIDSKQVADTAQRTFDLAVHLAGGQIDES